MPPSTAPPYATPVWRSLLEQLREALRYIAHMESVLALATLALILVALERAAGAPLPGAWLALPVARVLTLAYFYLVFLKATAGKRRLPRLGNYVSTWDALITPLVSAFVSALWLIAPILAAVHFSVGWQDFVERLQLSPLRFCREPYLEAYLALGWICFALPVGLLGAAGERRRLRLLDPLRGLRIAWRLGGRYVESLAAIHVMTLVGLLCDSIALSLEQQLPIPFVAPLLGHLLVLWVPLAQARILGELLYRRRATLGV